MQYRTSRLIKSYTRELASTAGGWLARNLSRLFTRLKDGFNGLDEWMTLRWSESLLRRYFIRMGEDAARSVSMMQPRGYVGVCLAICGLMSLGFLVVNPPAAKLSHRVRIDMSRPLVTPLSAREAAGLDALSAYELAALYEAGTGKSPAWFSSGQLSYEEAVSASAAFPASITERPAAQGSLGAPSTKNWLSSRSPLAMKNGRVIMRTSLGDKGIASLGEVRLNAQSTERPSRSLKKYADGTTGPEALLAELSLQGAGSDLTTRALSPQADAAPRWQSGRYGANIFEEPRRHWSGQYLAENGQDENFCPQDRMERASWLNMLYASHSKRSIYASKQPGHYRPFVERFAGHYSLQPSLVYAIMRVESGFNPLAVSSANALGLMQVVPETAGNEVHAFLRGKKAAPAPEVLFAPESNIEYGTTYLHLLTTRHFKDVKNPLSRELCTIAAYNGGPNAVYRVFNRDKNLAVEQINKLTSEQLYIKLLTGLSSQETRDYLPKVLAARNEFLRSQAKIQ